MQAAPPVPLAPPQNAVPQPQAAAVPPAMIPLAPQPTCYRDKYVDPATDVLGGNYINFYQEYGAATPANLRNAVYRDGNAGALMHVLAHVRNPGAQPTDPGLIVAYHRLTRHDTPFGQLARSFDQMGLAFFGDSQFGQLPSTVVIPDQMFNQLNVTQVPTEGRLQQLLIANPQEELFGPFFAGDPDVVPVTTRQLILVPNKYAAPFLSAGMTPRAAHAALSTMIQQDGNDIACERLLEWLRSALVRPAAQAVPRTAVAPLAPPAFLDPSDQQGLAQYRLSLMHLDLPQLQPTVHHNSAVLIAQGLNALTDEQRQARQDAILHRQTKEAPKTPSDYFGVSLDRLMRWCQVVREQDLPPIYSALANTPKGRVRLLLQTTIGTALESLRYLEDFPLSTSLATKIIELKWHSPLRDDFTVGLNIFCFGSLEEEEMEAQRRLNLQADTITAGLAAPSLIDLATIQNGQKDLCIPRTFAQLRYCVERSHAVWLVLLGAHHPVTVQHQRYRDMLISHEKRLENIRPRDPAHRHIVPALLARNIQVYVNHWLALQKSSASPVPFNSIIDVFYDIECAKQWDPSFPSEYLNLASHRPSMATETLSLLTPATEASTVSSLPSQSSGFLGSVGTKNSAAVSSPQLPKSAYLRNEHYKIDLFGPFKLLNVRAGAIRDRAKANNISLPLSAKNLPMCLSYHVLGHCNERCGRSGDHIQHNDKETNDLLEWCKLHYTEE